MNPIVWCDEAIVWGALQCYCYPAQDSGISQVQYSRTTRWGTLEYLLATRIEWAIPSGSQRGLAGKCTSYSSMICSLAMDRMFTCHGLAEGNISYMYTSQLPPPTPWIPSVPTGLQVMTAARKTIVAADNGGLWKEAVNAVIALVREPAAMRWTMVNQWSTRIWMYLMYLENGGWTGWTQKWHLQWRDDYEILWADKPWELEAYLFFGWILKWWRRCAPSWKSRPVGFDVPGLGWALQRWLPCSTGFRHWPSAVSVAGLGGSCQHVGKYLKA